MAQQTQTRPRDDTEEAEEYRTEQVVDATVMRVTGAGNYIVYPVSKSDDVKKGNAVKIIVSQGIMVEAIEDRISTPVASTWAIVVSGHQSIERCRVYYNKVKLQTIDETGKLTSEMRMPPEGSLAFHIPNSMELNDSYVVQVKDDDLLLRSETFGSIKSSVSLEAREERISTPISSTWAIVVSGHRSIERCQVFYNHVELNSIDHMGEARSELRMPRGGSLSFHIPDSMELNDYFVVQVRDDGSLLRSETFGSVKAMTAPQPQTKS